MSAGIKSILFKQGLSIEIEIISIAETLIKHRDNLAFPHRDNFYNIFWYQKGTANHFIDFKPVKVRANSILFVNKHRVQMFDPKGGYDGKFLLFTDSFFEKHPDDIRYLKNNILFNDFLEEPVISIKNNSHIANSFVEIESELLKPG